VVSAEVRLTIIDDGNHYAIAGNVVPPSWHHIQVEPTGVVLTLRKLKTDTHTHNIILTTSKGPTARRDQRLWLFSQLKCNRPALEGHCKETVP